MEDEIFDSISEIIRKSVNQPELKLTLDTSSKDVSGWDSLQHMIIISEIEKIFNVKFDFMTILDLKTVGDICNEIKKQK